MKRYRDGIARMFRAAEDIDAGELPKVLSYRDIERIVKRAETSDDALHMRMTKSKIRTPWSAERMAKFLQSSLFTGHATEY
ncbi:hypothetical protein [Salipiger sp.]|uniref:hypothetical protein n=1 Tax=Salipiger sp. TaxID=2078585 RepID=UPI003A96E810